MLKAHSCVVINQKAPPLSEFVPTFLFSILILMDIWDLSSLGLEVYVALWTVFVQDFSWVCVFLSLVMYVEAEFLDNKADVYLTV